MKEPYELIDTHCHLWDFSFASQWMTPAWGPLFRTFSPQDAEAAGRALGVSGAIVVEAGTSGEENLALQRACATSDYVLAFVAYVDLEDEHLDRQLEQWSSDPKCVGVRTRLEAHQDLRILSRPQIVQNLQRIAERGLIFEYLVRTHHLLDIVRLHEKVPHLKAVIEHMAKPDASRPDYDQWKQGIQEIARSTNVCCKLSLSPRAEAVPGLLSGGPTGWEACTVQAPVDHLLHCFGRERLMWGSDYPILKLVSDSGDAFATMMQALGNIGPETKRALFHDNAKHFYSV